MPTIALTGATGFVGGATLKRLLAGPGHVRALARPGRPLAPNPQLATISGTLDDQSALERLVHGCDAVIHVAGAISGRNYADFARTNVTGCEHLVAAMAQKAPQARLIHVSSLAAREPRLSDYAASKRAGEDVITSSALQSLIIRPPAVYGPADRALAPLWRLLARGWMPCAGSAQARFSLLHVDDLAEALFALVFTDSFETGTVCLHDGHPQGYSWREIADIAAARRMKAVRIVPAPPTLLRLVGAVNLISARIRGVRPPVLVPGKVPELVHPDWVCDNTRLPGCPDWKPALEFENCLETLPGWSHLK
jgi:2-alkyl-3-oxoalkanoate reductase